MNKSRLLCAVIGLLLAATAWSGDAQKGLDAYNSADYDKALAIFQPLAEDGVAEAQYGLGLMYGNGFGVMMDDALAIKWYSMAADQGHTMAQHNLAIMYQNGWGVPQNDAEANRLFALAAEQGNTEAMMALGRYYAMDYSAAYDPVEAYKWYSLAHMLNDLGAGAKREAMAEVMSVEQVSRGNGLVELWSNSHTELLAKQ